MAKKAVLVGLLAVGLLVAGAPARARMGGPMAMGGHGGGPGLGDDPLMLPLLLRGVGLTADQHAKVKDILQSHRATFRSLFTQLQSAHEGMVAKLLAPGTVTADDLAPQMKQVVQLRQQLIQEGLAVAIQVRAVLTPDQLSKAADVRQRMTELRSEMQKLMGGDGPGAPLDDATE